MGRIDTITGELRHLRRVDLPGELPLVFASASALDPSTGKMALLLIEPTPKTDPSGGDPASAWVVEFPTRNFSDEPPIPTMIDIVGASKKCTISAENTRQYGPTLAYVPDDLVV